MLRLKSVIHKSPAIEVRARHTLGDLDPEAKHAEFMRLAHQILDVRVAFTATSELTEAALETLNHIAGVLKEYPEVDIVLEGYFRQSKGSDRIRLMEVSKHRADLCRSKLVELGCTCDMTTEGKAAEQKKDVGVVKFSPLDAKLLGPTERLARVQSRAPIKFLAQTSNVSPRSQGTLVTCAGIVKELRNGIVLSCSGVAHTDNGIASPKPESLARKRLKSVQTALEDSGVTSAMRIAVEFTEDEQVFPFLTIDVDDAYACPSLDGPRALTNFLSIPELQTQPEPDGPCLDERQDSQFMIRPVGSGAVAAAVCRPATCFPSCAPSRADDGA